MKLKFCLRSVLADDIENILVNNIKKNRMKYRIYDIEKIISKFNHNNNSSEYFTSFICTDAMEAGIIKLKKGDEDTQEPHLFDEIYYVIKGSGTINIDEKEHGVNEGRIIFVPKRTPHRFNATSAEILVLYVIAG